MKVSLQTLLGVLFIFCGFILPIQAQTGCPGCAINLPILPADTVYLDDVPDAVVNEAFDFDLSFRLPKTTNPVSASDSTIPPNVRLDEFTILSITNLPPGLSWEANQTTFDVKNNQTDGCIKLCGTPLVEDTFTINVILNARFVIINREISIDIDMIVGPQKRTNAGFTMFNSKDCGTANVTFENNIPSNGNDGFSYSWDFGNGITSNNESPRDVFYDEPGVYIVKYRAIIDTIGYFLTNIYLQETSCDDTFSKPDIVFEVDDPNGNEIYESTKFNNTDPPINLSLNIEIGPGNYLLKAIDKDDGLEFGDDECVTTNFNRLSGGLLEGDGYKVILTILHPVDTIDVIDTVYVYDIPLAPTVDISGVGAFCEGDSTLLTTSLDGALQWYKDGDRISNADQKELVVKESGNYTLELTTLQGCTSISDPIEIVVESMPDAPSISVDKINFCQGDSAFFSNSYDNNVQWFKDGNEIMGANQKGLVAVESGVYSVRYTSPTGCESAQSDEVMIDVEATPDAPTVNADKLSFCIGDSALLVSSYVDGLQWFKDGTEITGANQQGLVVKEAGDYSVMFTSQRGCENTSDMVSITVNDLPEEPVFENEGNLLTISTAVSLPSDYTLQWYLNGNLVTPGVDTEYCIEESGNVRVVVIDNATGCMAEYTADVEFDPGFDCGLVPVNELYSILSWQINPNPVRDNMNIKIQLEQLEQVKIGVYDLSGKLLLEHGFKSQNVDTQIDVTDLPSGMYMIRLQAGSGQDVKKIVKE